mgnify:CR=1 FL=1
MQYDSSSGTGICRVTKNPIQTPFGRDERTAWVSTYVNSACDHYTTKDKESYELEGYGFENAQDAEGNFLYDDDGFLIST